MRTPLNLLRDPIAALRGSRNPHVLTVHSGFCDPCALLSERSLQFSGVLI